MNKALQQIIATLDQESDGDLLVKFALACVDRVAGFLTDERVIACLETGHRFVAREIGRVSLLEASVDAMALATSHQGSNGLDGAGNAAVSASHAVAFALQGKAVEAADYSAYAKVYSYSSHAVSDPQAYQPEYDWQLEKLNDLIAKQK